MTHKGAKQTKISMTPGGEAHSTHSTTLYSVSEGKTSLGKPGMEKEIKIL